MSVFNSILYFGGGFMKCPHCNKKFKMTQILLTKGSIKCSNCGEISYISKLKLYIPLILSLVLLYITTILKTYFDINKNICNIFILVFIFIMIGYVMKINPKK